MTKDIVKQKVQDILTSYLEINSLRKTPERYAILDAVYSKEGHFSLEEINDVLEKRNFPVSRATLYNTMKLFIKLRLITRHRFIGQTKYEACFNNEDHIHQVCTVCGSVSEVASKTITDAIGSTKLRRFHKDGFTLYIYGVCSLCQARLTRKKNQKRTRNTIEKK